MITHEEALETIGRHVRPLGAEQVETVLCAGRILAADVASRLPSPPFHKAAMDGFAVRAADVRHLPATLEVVGESLAGQWPDFEVGPGQCASIATGAPVPPGADTVVMLEHARALPSGRVQVEKLSGPNICWQGEDIRQGEVVLRAGQLLTPLRVGVAASAGHDRLTVYSRPSVAFICTGTEVVSAPGPVGKGQIYDANGPMLTALLEPEGSSFAYLGIVGDCEADLRAAVQEGLQRDLLVITGGVSVGQYDLVPAVLEEAAVEVHFRKCAIKPGQPVLFGTRDSRCVVGMPGNPLSCFVVFHVLLRAVLARMQGARDLPPFYRTGLMSEEFRGKADRKGFRPCRVEARDGISYVVPIPCRGSADIMSASRADAFFVVPAGCERAGKDQPVQFFEV